jgi:hypothetical protein
MAVTARVKVESKTLRAGTTGLRFVPDYQDGRNQEWAQATPSFDLNMTVKPEVGDLFEAGEAYTLTFEKTAAQQ